MADNLTTFAECVRHAPEVPEAEQHVREKLAAFAKTCPMGLLVRLGECVIDYRRAELRQKAESN